MCLLVESRDDSFCSYVRILTIEIRHSRVCGIRVGVGEWSIFDSLHGRPFSVSSLTVGQNYVVGKTANNYRKRLEAFYEGPGQAFKAKIRPVVEAALHVEGHVDMKTLIVAFGFFANSDSYLPFFWKRRKVHLETVALSVVGRFAYLYCDTFNVILLWRIVYFHRL